MEHPYKTPEADLAEEKLTARGFLSGGQPLWKAFWLFFAAGFLETVSKRRLSAPEDVPADERAAEF
ncbi:TPA: hypothetical protein SLV48_001224 [Pseudomonas aeruginosa]|nr:hypothetical protein [Pseudomonas aeruginosa]